MNGTPNAPTTYITPKLGSYAASVDGIAIIRQYIDRMVQGGTSSDAVSSKKISGMKVLLLDAITTQILSAVYSQTEILGQQVYLVTRLDDQGKTENGESSSHLKAICFVRPTPANIDLLVRELLQPRFIEYHLFFTGIVSPKDVRRLAEADGEGSSRVKQVQEFYADYIPVTEDLWTLQCVNTIAMTTVAGTSWAPKYAVEYERNVAGLASMLLSLKRTPALIRFAAKSPCAEELAHEMHELIQSDDIFQFRSTMRPPLSGSGGSSASGGGGLHLIILDRRDDPVTPLLSQWTYQAMVHELLGLNNHRVLLKGAPNINSPDLEEVVLSSTADSFFFQNRYKNFGELGENIQHLLQEYQKTTASHNVSNLNTVSEMQAFMEKFPEIKSQSHTVSKHVAIMGELARLVEVCALLDVSQLEQELACNDDHHAHWRELLNKLQSPAVKIPDKLRLGLLYVLRYEHSGNRHMVQNAMIQGGVPSHMVQLIDTLLQYAGTESRGTGLYGELLSQNNNLMSKMTKKMITSVQGIQNVYSQHVPVLMDVVTALSKGKLTAKTHPIVPGSLRSAKQARHDAPSIPVEQLVPDEVLIFIVGGVTYEEGTKISEWNANSNNRIRVILAGSTVHNSTSFLDEVKSTGLSTIQ
jgi:vacuolar protein sorting-associated protein 45